MKPAVLIGSFLREEGVLQVLRQLPQRHEARRVHFQFLAFVLILSVLHLNAHLNTTVVPMRSACEKEVFGKCYGSCPKGMKPAVLIGSFLREEGVLQVLR